MVCKNCGKQILYGNVCAECNKPKGFVNNMNKSTFENEYLTEKYNNKKGVYEGKATEHSNSFVGLIVVLVIVIIIVGIAVAKFLM